MSDDDDPPPAPPSTPEQRDGCLLLLVALGFFLLWIIATVLKNNTPLDMDHAERFRFLETLQCVTFIASAVIGIWGYSKAGRAQ
jgi:hypothetical protein